MSTEPLNTAPIEQFIKQVQGAENSNSKEIRIDIKNAKNLAFCLGVVMSRLHNGIEELLKKEVVDENETIVINADSGSW